MLHPSERYNPPFQNYLKVCHRRASFKLQLKGVFSMCLGVHLSGFPLITTDFFQEHLVGFNFIQIFRISSENTYKNLWRCVIPHSYLKSCEMVCLNSTITSNIPRILIYCIYWIRLVKIEENRLNKKQNLTRIFKLIMWIYGVFHLRGFPMVVLSNVS